MFYTGTIWPPILPCGVDHPARGPNQFLFLCLNGIGVFDEHWGKEGFNIIDLGRRPDINFQVAMKIRRVVRRQGVRFLHAHLYTSFFYAAALRGPSKNPPLPFTEHVTAIGCFVKPPLRDNEGIAGGRLDCRCTEMPGPHSRVHHRNRCDPWYSGCGTASPGFVHWMVDQADRDDSPFSNHSSRLRRPADLRGGGRAHDGKGSNH